MKKLEDYLYYEEENPDIRIYLGDCLEILPLLPKVDLVVTDPPYGLERFRRKDGGNSKKITSFGDSDENWNNYKPTRETFDKILKLSNKHIIWGMNNFDLPTTEHFLVWDKEQKMPSFAECELAWSSLSTPARIKRLRFEMDKMHPAQKPVFLLTWCITLGGEDIKNVLDPFLGSGTTLVACKELNRNGIGIEISEKYCAIAKQRLKATTKSLF